MSNFQNVSAGSIWIRRTGTVIPATTGTIFSTTETTLRSMHVYLTIFNTTENKYWTAHMTVGKRSGTWTRTIYGRVGDLIARRIRTPVNSGIIEITVENLESFDLQVTAAILTIP